MAATVTPILVATDFSPASDAALELAKTLADRFGASLHLLHVLEDPYVTGDVCRRCVRTTAARTARGMAERRRRDHGLAVDGCREAGPRMRRPKSSVAQSPARSSNGRRALVPV